MKKNILFSFLSLFLFLFLYSTKAFGQGTTCANAIPLSVGANTNGGAGFSTCDGNNTFSAPGPNSCFDQGATTANYASDKDLFFSFTPTISTCYNIIPYDTGGTIPGIFVYSGCPAAGNCVGGDTQLIDGINLQAGTQYIIVISTFDLIFVNDCFDFKIYISNPSTLPNDFCANAIPLEGLGSNYNATSCQEPDSWAPGVCQGNDWGTNENGVWYSFTNPSNQNFSITVNNIECISIDGSTGNNVLQLGIWSANSCNLGNNNFYGCLGATGNATLTVNNLPAGDYYLFVDGNAGALCTWGITSPDICIPPSIEAIPTDPACGQNNGSIILNITPSPAPSNYAYSYQWTGTNAFSATTKNITNLAAGTYTVTVTQIGSGPNAGLVCTATTTVTLTNPSGLNPIANNSSPICASTSSSTVNLSVNAANGYAWAGPNGFSSTQQNPTVTIPANTPAGNYTYTVTVTGTGGCTATASTIVVVNAVTPTASNNGPACQGEVIALSGGGGTNYTWSGANNFSSTQQNPNVTIPANAPAGNYTYTVTVTGAGGCTATASTTIAVTVVTPTASNNGPVCGSSGGSVTLTAGGGTTYAWNDGGPPTTNTNPFTLNIPAGTGTGSFDYFVTVTDGNGCSATSFTTVVVNTATASASANTPCIGGTLNLTANNGSAYSWAGPNGASSTQQNPTIPNITSANAGVYTVTVTAANGCTATASVNVTINTANASASNNSPVCDGSPVTLTATGGGTYQWSNGLGSNATATTTTAGTYTVTVTNNGCTSTAQTTVVVNSASASASNNSPVCDGSPVTLTATGGGTYQWSNGLGNNATANTTTAGTYTVTVTNNGCTSTAQTTVVVNSASASASNNGPVCDGSPVTLTATGGGTYQWSNGLGNNATANTTTAGTYTVTVTNNGCTSTATTTVTTNPPTTPTFDPITIACSGSTPPALPTTSTNGISGTWSPATINTTIGGTYTFVPAATECAEPIDISITIPTPITANITPTDALCNGATDGTINLTVSGGTPPYSYSWSGGLPNQEDHFAVAAGSYAVTITDSNDCSTTTNTTINAPTAVSLSTNSTNSSCNGANDGSIIAAAAGGTPNYTFVWSNGLPNGTTQNNLNIGTYTVTVSDQNNCSTTTTAIITEPTPISINVNTTDASCGVNNGSATMTTSGGSSPYTYSGIIGINPNNGNISGLGTGSYVVTVTDASACTATQAFAISNATGPQIINENVTDATCGNSNGSITISVMPNTGLTFTWSPNVSNNTTANNLPAGQYNVTVSDSNGCEAVGAYTIADLGAPELQVVNAADATCGQNNGSIQLTTLGGEGNIAYSWSPNVSNNANANNLAPNVYNVTITDANGCTDNLSLPIQQSQNPNITNVVTTPETCEQNNGSISINTDITIETYNWTGGVSNSATATGLNGGQTYTVTVTTIDGCSDSETIFLPAQPSPTITVANSTDPSCGQSNGVLVFTAVGGTVPLSYAWSSTNNTTNSANDLAAGTYTVTVTDSNGCSSSAQATLNNTNGPSIINTSNTPAVCGQSNGSASVVAAGGSGTLQYTWNTTPTQNTATANNLAAGDYIVTVTDENACTATASVSVISPNAPILSQQNITPSLCGVANGAITVTATGGAEPLIYEWSNTASITNTINNLTGGTYTVTVTDSNDCSDQLTLTVDSFDAPIINGQSVSPAICGEDSGSAVLTVINGTGTLTYSWSTPNGDQNTATGLADGQYFVTVTDENGCSDNTQIDVGSTPALVINVQQLVEAACGQANGGLVIDIDNSVGSIDYVWSTINGNGAVATDLAEGSYSVTVTDDLGCTAAGSFDIPNLPAPIITATQSTEASCGIPDGTASITVESQAGGLSYEWSEAIGAGPSVGGLTAGNYGVTVTDANGCTTETIVSVGNLGAPAVTNVVSQDATCGQANGGLSITTTGGVNPITFAWEYDGSIPLSDNSPTLHNIIAGNYSVTITDANSCSTATNVVVADLSGPTLAEGTITAASCGQATGSACVTVSGGTAPYTYLWNNNAIADCNNAIAGGNYTVTVTDTNGCTASLGLTVPENGAPSLAEGTITAASCGQATGSACVTVSGGTAPYTYLWNNNAIADCNNAIAGGNYTVTVTDTNGCTASLGLTVPENGAPSLAEGTITAASCGQATGSACVTVSGGTAPYTYLWNNNAIADCNNAIAGGNYTVTVTDTNGCTASLGLTVPENGAPSLAEGTITAASCGQATGSACVTVSGGTAPYTYLWNNNAIADCNNAIAGGNYTVTVTDTNGCTASLGLTVPENGAPSLAEGTITAASCGQADGSACVVATDGTAPYIYNWSNTTNTDCDNAILAGGYIITVTDANNCTATVSLTVPTLNGPTVSEGAITPENCGQGDGTACVVVTGGVGNISYAWNDPAGSTTACANSLANGSYIVTVSDENSCSVSITVVVGSNGSPNASASATTTTCGLSEGSVTAVGSAGQEPYTYQWNSIPSQNTATANNLPTGVYTVTVTDANNCTATASAEVLGEIADPLISCGTATTNSVTFVWGAVSGAVNYVVTVNGISETLSSTETSYSVPTEAGSIVTISVQAIGETACGNSAIVEHTCESLPAGCPTIAPIITLSDSIVCVEQTAVTLSATPTGGTFSGVGVAGNSFVPSVAGVGEHIITYNYTETVVMPVDTITCDYTATTPISVLAMPIASFTQAETVCVGETTTLTFAGSPATGATVAWTIAENPAQTGLSATATWNTTGTQEVSISVTTDQGCSDTFTGTVGVSSASVTAPPDQSIIVGSSIALPAQANSALNGALDFTWSPSSSLSCANCIAPQATPTTTTTYTVTVTDEWGCSASDNVTVEVAQENKLIIPNAFSPNGDNINEVFHIAGNNIAEFYMAIFDRWGQRVYETNSTNLNEGWNGLYPDGKRAELGVYVYQIEVTFTDDSTEFQKGNITLVW